MFNLSARQVSDDPRVNADALASDPAFAWAVIRSYANDNCHDPADMYVASLGAVSVACGFPLPRDPLAAHRAKRREGPTHHPDGRRVRRRGRRRRRAQRESRRVARVLERGVSLERRGETRTSAGSRSRDAR